MVLFAWLRLVFGGLCCDVLWIVVEFGCCCLVIGFRCWLFVILLIGCLPLVWVVCCIGCLVLFDCL